MSSTAFSGSRIPKIFPAGDPRYPSKEHECLEIIRKYDDSKLEVSQPRAEQSVWQTASGKLDFHDEPLVPKKIGLIFQNELKF